MLSWLSTAIWGSSNKRSELRGKFYKYTTHPVCLFLDCTAIVEYDSDSEVNVHEIVITPEDEEADEEYAFDLDLSRQFSRVLNPECTLGFAWRGEDEEHDAWYIFMAVEERNGEDIDSLGAEFGENCAVCLFESSHYEKFDSKKHREEAATEIGEVEFPFDLETLSLKLYENDELVSPDRTTNDTDTHNESVLQEESSFSSPQSDLYATPSPAQGKTQHRRPITPSSASSSASSSTSRKLNFNDGINNENIDNNNNNNKNNNNSNQSLNSSPSLLDSPSTGSPVHQVKQQQQQQFQKRKSPSPQRGKQSSSSPSPHVKTSSPKPSRSTQNKNLQDVEYGNSETLYPTADTSVQSDDMLAGPVTHYDDETDVLRAKADLFHFDEETKSFHLRMEHIDLIIRQVLNPEDFIYILFIERDGDRLMAQNINNQMQLQIYREHHSFIWTCPSPLSTWSAVFKDNEEELEFTEMLSKCLYETTTLQPFGKVKPEDRDWIINSTVMDTQPNEQENDDGYVDEDFVTFLDDEDDYEWDEYDYLDDDINNIGNEPEEEEEEEEAGFDENDEAEYEFDDADNDTDGSRLNDSRSSAGVSPAKKRKKGTKNSTLADSYRHGRTFVVRGSDLGVFRKEDDLEYLDTLKINTNQGEQFRPDKIMLHEQDSNLLFLHPDQENLHKGSIYRMDLERGEVVEEWGTQDMYKVRNMAPIRKYAQQTGEKTFAAMNGNSLFTMDPRQRGSNKIAGDVAAYNKAPRFSCSATTENGHLCVGSETGELRLYSGVPGATRSGAKRHPKTAKTLLPGFGDPIRHVDVTSDGTWVLATCANYLMVINTSMPDANDTGFAKRMGKDKPAPKRLQLLPEDIRMVGGKVDFTPARFNLGCDGETWIVTSTGRFIITWNFRKVKQGKLSDYIIKRLNQKIVDEQFANVRMDEPGSSAPIVVTMEDDVRLEKRVRADKAPFRQSRRLTFRTSD